MGNTIGSQRIEDLRSYLFESPDVVVHSLLASYKLFKVFHCAHESFKHGGVVVKLFIPNENEEDDHSDLQIESVLKPYRDATFLVQCRFSSAIHPNVVPYETAEILSRSAILLRQFFGRNLHDRLYSQPHLTTAHKKWITVQILLSLAQLHSVGVIHGDIKNENIFLVGSFQAILTDFSTFIKPVFLPLNDPVAATSLFFESGIKRRRCFIAPERFTEKVSGRVLDEHGRRMTFFDKEFTREFVRMDIFAAGLAIAELFLDGQHVVDLPELLAYRNGSFDLYAQVLSKIPDPTIRNIVTKMTQTDPANRYPSGISALEELFRSLPSGYQDFLIPLLLVSTHPVYTNADMRMMLLRHNWPYSVTDFDNLTELEIFHNCVQSSSLLGRGVMASIEPLLHWSSRGRFPHPNLSSGSLVVDKILTLYGEGMHVHMNNKGGEEWRDTVLPTRINQLMNEWWTNDQQSISTVSTQNNFNHIIPILVSFLGSTVSACNFTKSKIVYLEMIKSLIDNFSTESEEEEINSTISDYIIPYIYELILTDSIVRDRAIEILGEILKKLTNAETGLFSEYLFPLCVQLDCDSAVRLATLLVHEAARLSQPDPGGKRLQAIALFADRMITRATEREWTNSLIANVELFSLFDKTQIQNKLVPRMVQWATGKETQKNFCMHVEKFCSILKEPKLIDPFLSGLLVDCLAVDDISIVLEAIQGIGRVVSSPSFPLLVAKQFIVSNATALIPLMSHPWFEIRSKTESVLVENFGAVINPVDQFVFLRHLMPEGCRTLFDLSRAVRNVPAIVPPPNSVVKVKAPIVTGHVAGNAGSLSSNGQTLSLQMVNPFFRSPRGPRIESRFTTVTPPTQLRNYADWRWEVSGYPRPLNGDLGCLSNPDGSLMSLYTGTSIPGLTEMHACNLANSPCIPPVGIPGRSWKPENLLLATLNDFSNGGVAVPVVSTDTTDDGRLIVAGGADCVVRLWRTSALETESVMQCSRVWQVHNASRLYKLRTLRNTKSVAIGTDDSMAVYSLGQESGNKPVLVSPTHSRGHVLQMDCFDTDLSSCVVSACEKGAVLSWDIRTNKMSWELVTDPTKFVVPSGLVLSKDARSFAVSGINGNMTVYDIRYLKPVWNYCLSGTSGITAMTASSEQKSVWVSSGSETCLFDLENGGEPKFTTATVSPSQPPVTRPTLMKRDQLPNVSPDFSISRVLKAEGNARCLKECAGNPWTLLSGHNDGVARYWSRNMSGIVCPLQLDPSPAIHSQNMVIQQVVKDSEGPREDSQAYAGRPCTVTEGHRDVINDICIASLQYDVIVTAGRDGLIKLWK